MLAVLVLVAAAIWGATGGTGSTHHPAATSAPRSTTTTVLTTSTVPATTVPLATTTTTVGAGALPQTDALPSADSPQFLAAMADLFGAVAHDTPTTAGDAFFPEAAYVQLKSIGDASADWQDRLLAEYELDIGATAAALGPGAPSAVLVSVQVPMGYAHWVPPGVCDNDVGYYEVANSRMIYSLGGVTRSFGIASLISWRGEWYVVHLGAILRPGSGGVVLDPVDGPGQSPPSTTC